MTLFRGSMCLFGSRNKILHFDPIFPQNAIFCQFVTGQKILRQKGFNNGDMLTCKLLAHSQNNDKSNSTVLFNLLEIHSINV